MAQGSNPRALRIVLFASLALNLLVVGAAVGIAVNGPPGPPGGPRGSAGQDTALPYTRALDEDQRRDLRRQLRREITKDRQDMREVRAALLAGYQEALALLRADTFDAAAMSTVLDRQAERGAQVRVRGQALLTEYLSGLSTEDRMAYADRLEAELEKVARRNKRNGDERKPPRD